MKYPLKLIEWEDAYSGDHRWTPAEDLVDEPVALIIQSIGFEVRRTAERLTLAMSLTSDGKVCDLFTIPLVMIRKEQTFRRRSLKEELERR